MAIDELVRRFKGWGITDESPILNLVAQRISELAIKMLPSLYEDEDDDPGIRVIKKRPLESDEGIGPEEISEPEVLKQQRIEEPPVIIQQPIPRRLNSWIGGFEEPSFMI